MRPKHPLQRRLVAEEFVRIRRADERRRYAASQRRGRVDANPHQIDAVAYALKRIPEGGCILADEVGLGKTIEAGLVMAQLMAEGMRRILLIVPKALVGQWQTELYTLFGFDAKIGTLDPDAFVGEGVFIVNREFAGGVRGAPLISAVDPFDLAVIDEAHEIFSGIYKRFDRKDEYVEESKHTQTAHRVRGLLQERRTPVLLLTATPMQNNLAELWGLVHYIEPNHRLLGSLSTFRKVYVQQSQEDDGLPDELSFELRQRLKYVVQRTLRRQAQEFLEVPFVERQAKTVEYSLTPSERSLYNDITAWLMTPQLFSFTSGTRRLLIVGFHRRMASSLAALRASLDNVANRLREQLAGKDVSAWDQTIDTFAADLEEADGLESTSLGELDLDEEEAPQNDEQRTEDKIQLELNLVDSFIVRARELEYDTKADCLLTALSVIQARQKNGSGTGKVVIFTESIQTQEFLSRLLIDNGYSPKEITLFRGTNNQARAREALKVWQQEVASTLPASQLPTNSVAVRLALVHEFKTRSKVFISTEAGAKGLNLQFCESLINYDLPWNPQRIEQRIGRVHRYGQKRGVTVFNLLDPGNEAAKLTYEILSQKLDLFGKVLDLSDDVLHTPDYDFPESLVSGVGVDLEARIRQIYQQSTSLDDVAAQLRELRDNADRKRCEFDETQERVAKLIESRLDDTVAQIFRRYKEELPACLAEIDEEVDEIFQAYLDAKQIAYERTDSAGLIKYKVESSANLPGEYRSGCEVAIGDVKQLEDGDYLYQGHPLINDAIEESRESTCEVLNVLLMPPKSAGLEQFSGKRGRLRVSKLKYRGLAPVDRLVVTALTEGALDPIEGLAVGDILACRIQPTDPFTVDVEEQLFDECFEETVLEDQSEVTHEEEQIFESRLEQLDRYIEDRILILKQKQGVGLREVEELERRKTRATSPTVLSSLNDSLKKVNRDLDKLDQDIRELRLGKEPNYEAWRESLFERRFRKPDIETVVEVAFEICAEDSTC
jgi:hypothetical protein